MPKPCFGVPRTPTGLPKTIDFATTVCQNLVFGPPGPPQAHPPCFVNIGFGLVFTGPSRCGPKNRRLQVLQGAALPVFTVFVHVVFPLVFSGQTRPWAVQWLPQCMLTATADQLQDPPQTSQGTKVDLQQTPKGQPRSPKASAGASKGRANGRSKGTKSLILMATGLKLESAGSRSVNNPPRPLWAHGAYKPSTAQPVE